MAADATGSDSGGVLRPSDSAWGAWRAGVVVVVAAGNDGERGATRLTMPAVDPYVFAVGSTDHHGSDMPEETTAGAWTNDGTTTRRPDLLAPGKSVVSLRVPGSLVDCEHPEGLIVGDPTGRMLRGTGTSQSAAVVSGAAALLLQCPSLTPDQVKGPWRQLAVAAMSPTRTTESCSAERRLVLLGGCIGYIFGVAGDAPTWATASAQRRSWSAGTWRGTSWAGRDGVLHPGRPQTV